VVERGTRVTPGWTAVLAAAGCAGVDAHPPPRVAVLACGDELRAAGDLADVRAGRAIPESNGPMIAAAVRAAGGIPVRLGIARDDPTDLRQRISGARGCDLLVTLGGASMGEADLLKRVLLEDGLELDFWRVRMRPGSPVSFGHLPRPGESPLPTLGLPGNPASAFVTFQVLARPFLRRLAGDPRPHRQVVSARAGEAITAAPGLCHLFRVTVDASPGAPGVRLAGPQGSGLVSGLGPAQGLAVVPEGVERVAEGDPLDVILLDDGAAGAPERGYAVRPGTG
jgi:molybdopterin molybdotransferase